MNTVYWKIDNSVPAASTSMTESIALIVIFRYVTVYMKDSLKIIYAKRYTVQCQETGLCDSYVL